MTRPALLVPLIAVLATAGAWLPVPLAAQAPAAADGNPKFEVASIKRNTSGPGLTLLSAPVGGRVTFTNLTLQQLITRAYQVQPYQLIGGPGWLTNDRFDVIAKAEGDATLAQVNLMLRELLADRFKLVAHTETRELPVYYLVTARDDGRLGPELKPATAECGAAGRGAPGGPPPPAAAPGAPAGRIGGAGGACQMLMTPGRLQAGGQPLAQLASLLGNQVGRPVIDRSGLTGSFDFALTWLPDGRGAPIGPRPPGAPELPPIDPDAPSLFTAIQEQLGLKLEAGRGPVDVLVIDSVQPPTED